MRKNSRKESGNSQSDELNKKIAAIDKNFISNASKEFVDKMFDDNKTIITKEQFQQKLVKVPYFKWLLDM